MGRESVEALGVQSISYVGIKDIRVSWISWILSFLNLGVPYVFSSAAGILILKGTREGSVATFVYMKYNGL